jgi:hypothetical protein
MAKMRIALLCEVIVLQELSYPFSTQRTHTYLVERPSGYWLHYGIAECCIER